MKKQTMSFVAGLLTGMALLGGGAAYAAGIAAGVFDREKLFAQADVDVYQPKMEESLRKQKLEGWKQAVRQILTKENR